MTPQNNINNHSITMTYISMISEVTMSKNVVMEYDNDILVMKNLYFYKIFYFL